MTIKEAYEKWGKQKERQTLYAKTRNSFMLVWKLLDFEKPCKELTLAVLADAMRRRGKLLDEDKVRAASVMLHVLNYAHQEEPEENPKPNFDYPLLLQVADAEEISPKMPKEEKKVQKFPKIAPKEPEKIQEFPKPAQKLPQKAPKESEIEQKKTKQPSEREPKQEAKETKPEVREPKQEVKEPKQEDVMPEHKKARTAQKVLFDGKRDTLGRSKNRAKRHVAQIDPLTLKVVKVWESMGGAESALGVLNISRAIYKRRLAGGYYWCDEKDAATFEPKRDGRAMNGNAKSFHKNR